MAGYGTPFAASSRPVAPAYARLGRSALSGRCVVRAMESEPQGLRPGPARQFGLQPEVRAWHGNVVGQQENHLPGPTPTSKELVMPRPRPLHLMQRHGVSYKDASPATDSAPGPSPSGPRPTRAARPQQHKVPNIFVASCALIDSDARVLLGMRTMGNAKLRGFFEFPGGKVEENEPPQIAAARELEEELGVRVARGSLHSLTFVSHHYVRLGHNFVCLLFSCEDWEGEPVARLGQELRWVGASEIPGYMRIAPPPTRLLLAAVQTYLRGIEEADPRRRPPVQVHDPPILTPEAEHGQVRARAAAQRQAGVTLAETQISAHELESAAREAADPALTDAQAALVAKNKPYWL